MPPQACGVCPERLGLCDPWRASRRLASSCKDIPGTTENRVESETLNLYLHHKCLLLVHCDFGVDDKNDKTLCLHIHNLKRGRRVYKM